MTANPFFTDWTAPYGLPPFAEIRPEHFPPAFDRGMAEIAAIAGSAEPPSFANTIAALERAGRLLERVSRVFFNLEASDANDALESIARDYAPKLAQHQTRVALDPALFARVADLHARRASLGLAADALRLLERQYLRLTRAGVEHQPPFALVMQDVLAEQRVQACQPLVDRRHPRLFLGPEQRAGAGEAQMMAFDRPQRVGGQAE